MDKLIGKLSAENTLNGKLSAEGTLSATIATKITESQYDIYTGDTVIIPDTSDIVLGTADKVVKSDILVKEIPAFETSNEYGTTFIIAS